MREIYIKILKNTNYPDYHIFKVNSKRKNSLRVMLLLSFYLRCLLDIKQEQNDTNSANSVSPNAP